MTRWQDWLDANEIDLDSDEPLDLELSEIESRRFDRQLTELFTLKPPDIELAIRHHPTHNEARSSDGEIKDLPEKVSPIDIGLVDVSDDMSQEGTLTSRNESRRVRTSRRLSALPLAIAAAALAVVALVSVTVMRDSEVPTIDLDIAASDHDLATAGDPQIALPTLLPDPNDGAVGGLFQFEDGRLIATYSRSAQIWPTNGDGTTEDGYIVEESESTIDLSDITFRGVPFMSAGQIPNGSLIVMGNLGTRAFRSPDLSMMASFDITGTAFGVTSDGRIVVIGDFGEDLTNRVLVYDSIGTLRQSPAVQAPLFNETAVRKPHSIESLADGRIAIGLQSGNVALIDADRPNIPLAIRLHNGPVNAVVQLPDGRIASAGADGVLNLWDVPVIDPTTNSTRPTVTASNRAAGAAINALIALDSSLLAFGDSEGNVGIWNPTSDEIGLYEGHTEPITTLIQLADGRIASGDDDGNIQIWEIP